jgi:two-component system chemotaxis response regulator CheB
MAQKQVNKPAGLIIIGGSSGSIEALLIILPQLKKNLALPILIVLHRTSSSDNSLAFLLSQRTSLTVKEADEKDLLLPGHIYLAPSDYHVLLEENGTLSLDASEKVNYCRPSIDVSFTSAALVYQNTLVAVLLSGANADGAQGMAAIKENGGYTIVQDPAEAAVAYMPEQAILLSEIDCIFPAFAIGEMLNTL